MAVYDGRPSPFTQLSTTADWESFCSTAGVADGIDGSNSFTPSLDTVGRNAVIGVGQAIIRGALWRCDASVSTPIPAASAQNRIDRLVLRINRGATSSPTYVQPVVITGTPSGTPVEPPLVRTAGGLWDLPICSWTSASTGALSGLVDERQYAGINLAINGVPWSIIPNTADPTYLKIQQGSNPPLFISQNGLLVAAYPGNPAVPEGQRVCSLASGFSHIANLGLTYYLMPDDTVEIHGAVSSANAVTGTATVTTLPSTHKPNNRSEPIHLVEEATGSPYTAVPHTAQVDTAGNLRYWGSSAAGCTLTIHGRFPRNAPT